MKKTKRGKMKKKKRSARFRITITNRHEKKNDYENGDEYTENRILKRFLYRTIRQNFSVRYFEQSSAIS